jgi:uncharacterized Zn-finger protein
MPFKCKNCHKEFTRKYGLLKHEKAGVCTKKKFECTKCNAKYAYKRTLARHMIEKHSETIVENNEELQKKEKKKVQCPYCENKYSNKYVLKNHMTNNCKKNPNISQNKESNNEKTVVITQNNNINNGNITNNTQNITNNTNITFQLNNFGEESLKNITDEEFCKAISNPNTIPQKYLELKYIKKKENRNVYRNSKENKLYIRKNNDWVEQSCEDDVYHQMKIRAIDDIDEFMKKKGTFLFNKDEIDKRLNRIERASFLMRTIQFMLDTNEEILHDSYTENPSVTLLNPNNTTS